jgi:hypothetical protein
VENKNKPQRTQRNATEIVLLITGAELAIIYCRDLEKRRATE